MTRLSKCEFHFSYPRSLKRVHYDLEHSRKYHENAHLRKALSKKYNISEGNIVIFRGAIELLKEVFLNAKEQTILLPDFTWAEYDSIAEQRNVHLLRFSVIERDGIFTYDADEIISKSAKAYALLLPSPNNPTGHALDEKQLCAILDSVQKPVIVDAAYWGFAKTNIRYEELVRKYPNLAVVCSFSKFFGMPGLRCGYAVIGSECKKRLMLREQYLDGLHPSLQKLAILALREEKHFARIAKRIVSVREWFFDQLKPFGEPFKGAGNFILVRTTEKRQKAYLGALARAKIDIKSFSHDCKAYLRIDIAPKKVLQKVIAALKTVHD